MDIVPIPGFEEYDITKEGLVTREGVPVKIHIHNGRAPYVRIRGEQGYRNISIAKLVLYAFVGQPKYPSDIPLYKDGNNHNYHIMNLEWSSRSNAYAKLYKRNNRYYENRVKGVIEALGKPVAAYHKKNNKLVKHSEYPTVSEAARVMSVAPASISRCLKDEKYTCKGYVWKEIEKVSK